MTGSLTTSSAAGPPAELPRTAVPPRNLEWLSEEVAAWRAAGLVDDDQAQRILGRYYASRRFTLAALVLTLGAAFVGIGLIWLVAANLDQLPPLARFLVVAALWVAVTIGAEFLASRREHGGPIPSPVVFAVRSVAALAIGAVIFQAAQSLQVPAYEPKLVGFWSVAALLYAYAVRSMGPLLIGLGTGTFWLLWQTGWDGPSGLAFVLALGAAAAIAVSVGTLHGRWWPTFAVPWRELGAGLALVTLFVAAVPAVTTDDFSWSAVLVVAMVLAGVLTLAGVVAGSGWSRLEPAATLTVGALAVLLVWWDTGSDTSDIDLADWGHAAVAIITYVGVAVGVAVLGALRDSWRLTALATIALVVFTTFQSFAVFAAILPGAWLFVALGLVFLATGFLFDRARRRLALELADERADRAADGDRS